MKWTGSVDLQSAHVVVVVVSRAAILLMVCDNFEVIYAEQEVV